MKNILLKVTMVTIGLVAAQATFAANCSSTISNNAVGSLTVPAGATCTVNHSSVDGSITVQKGASLVLNNSSVSGKVQASTAKSLKLINSSIESDVQAAAVVSLDKAMISGNFYCSPVTKLQSSNSMIEGKTVGKCR